MLNEFLILQIISTFTLLFFINTINILTLWYLAGLFLFNFGFYLLLENGGIFVGFLWIIDLGVGLVFFLFILHFLNFLYQKSTLQLTHRFVFLFLYYIIFFLFFFYFFSTYAVETYHTFNVTFWNYFISFYNYFSLFNLAIITDLNILHYIYFYNNSFFFFIINFMLLYGIFLTILLTFLIKKIFLFLNFSQIENLKILTEVNTYFFIKSQNFLKQQTASIGTRVWKKKKYSILNDF